MPEQDERRAKLSFRKRLVEQSTSAIVAFLLVTFIGWLIGLGDLKTDFALDRQDRAQTRAVMTKLQTTVEKLQGDVIDMKSSGAATDMTLDKRASIIEHDHMILFEELRRLQNFPQNYRSHRIGP